MNYSKEHIADAAKMADTLPSEIEKFANRPDVIKSYGMLDVPDLASKYLETLLPPPEYGNEGRNYPVPYQSEPPIPVVAQRLPIPTTVNPYAGTTQEAANPEAPNASLISQFDPAALQAAQAEFNKKYEDSQASRTISNVLAGLGAGSTKNRSMEFNQELKEEQLKSMYDRTIGAQLRQQAQATAGEAAVTSAQAREVAAGQFTGTQRAKQIELDLSQLNLNTQKRINESTSPETMTAKIALTAQLRNMANALSADDLAQIKAVMDKPDVTAQQLLPLMAQYAPAAYKSFLDQIGATKTAAEAAQATGLGAQAAAAGRKTDAETAVLKSGDPVRVGAGMAPAFPNEVSSPPAADSSDPNAPKRSVLTPSIDGSGNVSLSQSTYSQQTGRETGQDMAELQRQATVFNNTAREAILDVAKTAGVLGGVTASSGRNLINWNNDKEVKEFQLKVDKLNQEATALGLIAPEGSGVGSAVGAAGAQISQQPGLGGLGTAISAAAPLFRGQPVTVRSNPKLLQELSYAVLEARAKQQAIGAQYEMFARRNSGDGSGFTNTDAYKNIINRVLMINPKTGDYAMVDNRPGPKAAAVKDGYFEKSKVLK